MIPLQLINLLCLASAAVATPNSLAVNGSSFKYLVSFGDSYSQTGFSITGAKPSTSNPIGNPAFPGYTTTNGNNWITYLLQPASPTTLLSYNFASGGATTDASLVKPFQPTVLSLIDQVTLFTTHLSLSSSTSTPPVTPSNTLFAIWIGVNDVGNAFSSATWPSLSQEITTQYLSQVQTLYSSGARNFLFLTVPPIQLTPMVLAESNATQTQEGAAVEAYNALLAKGIKEFEGKNEGVTTWVFETSGPFEEAIKSPKSYGARDASCYDADGTSCLWFNNYHPGQAIHKLVAEGVAALVGL
ncbi:carbohydrate esterase family 16 protein [Hyaloscypha variabilis F]|uniref:Carbohydrate esterase family 16 protein n=1 Tax=Hyaloscypha variabilis (strain UAMH 11265 / GT02V1 / F) TaxID=1149755 RepID=A0A2J6R5U0_HYAVF|nr:carbohydrate esterase family 16 protein [Hyaloscypha variabilis F]